MLQDVVDEECTLILLGTGSVDSFGIIQKVSRIFGSVELDGEMDMDE
jgi:hypothetical protein